MKVFGYISPSVALLHLEMTVARIHIRGQYFVIAVLICYSLCKIH